MRTHVHPWWIHVNVWQNQYSIVSKIIIIILKSCILPPAEYLYAEYIMQNARLDEAQAGIKTVRRNINSLRHTNDMTLIAEREELESLLMKMKEESEKVGLKHNI